MLISDNETKTDLLNNEAIAKTIANLIKESKQSPISIGVHGDWGAGKSSVLEMIETQFANDEKVSCIRFNGWRHQGIEDSKIALMGAVISELKAHKSFSTKAEEIIKKLWKNINWFSVAKQAGKIGVSLATGTAPIALLSSAFDVISNKITDTNSRNSAIDGIEQYLKDAKITDDTTSNTEFREFQQNFSELLSEAKIEKLVVLIDDLDRCLPEVTIETLEAVRLFMFVEKTAFVVAADETMIQYAVKKHFPDATDEDSNNLGDSFSRKYLEKLIQVPFRIPALGNKEVQTYVCLLMAQTCFNDEKSETFGKLRTEALKRLRKPWEFELLTLEEIQSIIGNVAYEKIEKEIVIASQIGLILAQNTRGNPRIIKRFINMLLLRHQVALNRGFEDDFDMGILAKLMLAEYFQEKMYENIARHLDPTGQCLELAYIESRTESTINNKNSDKAETEQRIDVSWLDNKEYIPWLSTEPKIGGVDLRPYFFACKEKVDLLTGDFTDVIVSRCVGIVSGGSYAVHSNKDEINRLTEPQEVEVFEIVTNKIKSKNEYKNMPKEIEGLRVLVSLKVNLRKNLAEFISSLNPSKVGIWVLSGWEECLPKECEEYRTLYDFFEILKEKGSKEVKVAIKAALK